ncbi:MAG: hypothetical protein FWF88_08180 [Peptococcaceae bacterium]|nr:hypothetical protein [Peptococcaceae bacterium]
MKKIIPLLLVILVIGLLSPGCKNKEADFYSNADKVFVNSEKSDKLTFRLALFGKAKINEVTCTGLAGVDLGEGYAVEVTGVNDEALDAYTYKDLFVKYVSISVKPPVNFDGECAISGIKLDVDGTAREITFKTPVKHAFKGGNVSTEAMSYAIPSEVTAKNINNAEQAVPYMLMARGDITVQKISFLDYLEPGSLQITVDDESVEDPALPISLKDGQTMIVSLSPSSVKADAYSFVATNIYFEYTIEGSDTVYTNSVSLIFDPIFPLANGETEELNKMVDALFFP